MPGIFQYSPGIFFGVDDFILKTFDLQPGRCNKPDNKTGNTYKYTIFIHSLSPKETPKKWQALGIKTGYQVSFSILSVLIPLMHHFSP
jgi:hypothetical protein